MKQTGTGQGILLLAALLCAGTTVSAQNVLEYSLNAPRPDDILEKQEIAYFPAGDSGEDVLWDFSELVFVDDFHTEFICGSDSTVLTAIEPEMMRKYIVTADSLMDAGYENALHHMCYDKPVVLLTYPFPFGSRIDNTFSGEGLYCGTSSLQNRGSVCVEADSYGSISLSDEDTLRNVLRVHIIKSGSVNMNILGDTAVFDPDNLKQEIEERYQWYVRGYRYPLFETVSTTSYNNMWPVSNVSRGYCYLPGEQRLLADDENEEIAACDSIMDAARIAGKQEIFHYDVDVSGTSVTVSYSLDQRATITSVVCNQMGFLYRSSTVTSDAGEGYSISFDCSGLLSGTYILYINVNGTVYNETVNLE